ncbi:MAG: hypothetical protein AAGM22_21130 [Acidobacteriota bacterium]
MQFHRLILGAFAGAVATLVFATPADASCVNHGWSNPRQVTSNVYLNISSLTSAQKTILNKGMKQWNDCNTASDIPFITGVRPAGDFREVEVRIIPGFNPRDNNVCGEFQGLEIRLYTKARNPQLQTVPCDRSDILEDSLAHEVGHVIGFDHPDPNCGSCDKHVMSRAKYRDGRYTNRKVQTAECNKAAEMNYTNIEISQIEDDNDTYNSPILIDFDRNQFHLSEERVFFDIDADGELEFTNWTAGDQEDSFLVWDKNGNGVVDDGSELFGDSTILLLTGKPAAHGYEALAELDMAIFGGNGDGFVSEADALFDQLSIWTDINHDGYSQGFEMVPAADSRLVRMNTRYHAIHPRYDSAGNLFLFFSRAWIEDGSGDAKRTWTTDVFFRGFEID